MTPATEISYDRYIFYVKQLWRGMVQMNLRIGAVLQNLHSCIPNRNFRMTDWCKKIWATTWQNQQNECAPSEDSDQPGHPPSLIRVFAVRMKKAWSLSYPLSAQQRLWSDWVDAQADLSLHWAHTHFVGFVMSQLMLSYPRGCKTTLVHDVRVPFWCLWCQFLCHFPPNFSTSTPYVEGEPNLFLTENVDISA